MKLRKLIPVIYILFLVSCSLSPSFPSIIKSEAEKVAEEDDLLVSRLVFIKGYDIWMVNNAQNDLRNLTNTGEPFTTGTVECNPALSPDGTKIVFRDLSATELYLMDTDGSNRETLPLGEGHHTQPSWSHDGKRIVYVTYNYNDQGISKTNYIHIYDIDSEEDHLILTLDQFLYTPSFSPDDKTIIFSQTNDIYTMSVTGENINQLTDNVEEHWYTNPQFSPNGKKILFVNYLPGQMIRENMNGINIMNEVADLFVMNRDGSNIVQLTDTPFSEEGAFWSSSGKHIVYLVFDNEATALSTGEPMVMTADSSEQRILIDMDDFPALFVPTPTPTPQPIQKTITSPFNATLTQVFTSSSGSINNDELGKIGNSFANVEMMNFMVEVSYVVPSDVSKEAWSFGLVFRQTAKDENWQIIAQDGVWYLYNCHERVDSGSFYMHTDPGDINRLRFFVVDDVGYLYLNDELVDTLDLSARLDTGDIATATQLFSGDQDNITIQYEDFNVWSIND